MKLIRKSLLMLLTVAAAFTSCTKEEVFVQEEATIQGEFAGAKLVGTNVSIDMDFGEAIKTKVSNKGKFEEGDRSGLGWIIAGKYSDEQTGEDPTGPELFANHLYTRVNNDWITYGNMYEGWHFAYYPFAYQKQVAGQLEVAINPVQKYSHDKDRYANNLWVSPRAFITEENNLDKTNNKLTDVSFNFYPAKKVIRVGLTPEGVLTTAPELKDLKIKSVTINTNKYVFYANTTDVKLNPEKLISMSAFDAAKEDPEKDEISEFYRELQGVWGLSTLTKASNLTTEIAEENSLAVGEAQDIRFFTLPIEESTNLNMRKVSLTVNVDNGFFTIPYTMEDELEEGEELSIVQQKNNAAFEKLNKAFRITDGNTGFLTTGSSDYVNQMGLDFILTVDMFTADFDNISSELAWNNAVALANTLTDTSVEFTTTGNWEFTGPINLPKMPLTVKEESSALKLNGTAEWPAQTATNFIVNTKVVVNSDLVVAGLMKAKEIENNATINAGAKSEIYNLINNDRVIVDFGAKVYTKVGDEGIIAYEVEDSEQETIAKINSLVNSDNVKVNTLVVKTALGLKAVADPGKLGNVYGDYGLDAIYLTELDDVDIELAGGSLFAQNGERKVKNVVAVSGTTSIQGINITGNKLDVQAGTMTATDVEFDAMDAITVAEGAVLNIEKTGSARVYKTIADLTVSGTVNVNFGSLTLANLVVNKGASCIVSEVSRIVWTSKTDLKGNTKGVIARGATTAPEFEGLCLIAGNNETVYLAANDITFDKLTNIAGKNINLNLNGNTIKLTNKHLDYNVKISEGTINSQLYLGYQGSTPTAIFSEINFNVTPTTGNSNPTQCSVIEVQNGNLSLYNCTFNNPSGRPLEVHSGFSGDMLVSDCLFNKVQNTNFPYFLPFTTGHVTLTNNEFKVGIAVELGKESNFTITNNKFVNLDFIKTEAIDKAFINKVKANNTFSSNGGINVNGVAY